MAAVKKMQSKHALVSLLCLWGVFVPSLAAASTQTIDGRILWPEEVTSAAKIKLILNLEGGRKLYGWPKADGAFSLTNVPEGTHLLDVVASGLVYPQVRLEVDGTYPGGALVTFAENRGKVLPPPLVLKPTSLAQYFEKRAPFDLVSFIKTPYGLMAAFGIFAVVVLPRLKVDPEELKEAKESLMGGPSGGAGEEQAVVRRRN